MYKLIELIKEALEAEAWISGHEANMEHPGFILNEKAYVANLAASKTTFVFDVMPYAETAKADFPFFLVLQ